MKDNIESNNNQYQHWMPLLRDALKFLFVIALFFFVAIAAFVIWFVDKSKLLKFDEPKNAENQKGETKDDR